jgi:hypothetical protein
VLHCGSRIRARVIGACLYLGAVVAAFAAAADWGQAVLLLASFAAGLLSGRWWSVVLATLIVPVTAVWAFLSFYEYDGDSFSGPLDVVLFIAVYGTPTVAVAIALGIVLRRIVGRRRKPRLSPPDDRTGRREPAANL